MNKILKNKDKLKYLCMQIYVYIDYENINKFVTADLPSSMKPRSCVEETVICNPLLIVHTKFVYQILEQNSCILLYKRQ